MFLAVVLVTLKLIARFFISHTSEMDDWCALGATIVAIGMIVSMGSWDIVPIYLCSVVEVSSALIASSIPALRKDLPKCRNYFERAKKRLSETPQKLESGPVSTSV